MLTPLLHKRVAKQAARELLAEPGVGAMVDRLPLRPGARVVAFGNSLPGDEGAVSVGDSCPGARRSRARALGAVPLRGWFRNQDFARVAEIIAAFEDPAVDLFERLGGATSAGSAPGGRPSLHAGGAEANRARSPARLGGRESAMKYLVTGDRYHRLGGDPVSACTG
jgi:hypothetical protein